MSGLDILHNSIFPKGPRSCAMASEDVPQVPATPVPATPGKASEAGEEDPAGTMKKPASKKHVKPVTPKKKPKAKAVTPMSNLSQPHESQVNSLSNTSQKKTSNM